MVRIGVTSNAQIGRACAEPLRIRAPQHAAQYTCRTSRVSCRIVAAISSIDLRVVSM